MIQDKNLAEYGFYKCSKCGLPKNEKEVMLFDELIEKVFICITCLEKTIEGKDV